MNSLPSQIPDRYQQKHTSYLMTLDDIWTTAYEKGLEIGADILPLELKQLWHYIDFTYYVDNGGGIGFLSNKNPTEDEIANYFEPYIESWKFFELLELATLVENYNSRFLEAIKVYNQNGKKDFQQYEKKLKIDELAKNLDILIVKVVWTDENSKVWNWLEKNQQQLQNQIQAL